MTAETAVPLAGIPAEPGVEKPDPVLTVEHLRKAFGGLVAVDVEHLEVQRGLITAVIGPNGAGKTTLFNLLTGFDRPDRGTWTFDGVDLTGKHTYRVARAGVVRTFQLTRTLNLMTVLDNMKLAAGHQRGERFLPALIRPLWRSQEAAIEAIVSELLEHVGLTPLRNDLAGTLSGGQRKLLELARALMADPSLVMLDEPTAGVNPVLKKAVLDHVEHLRTRGRTVLFVEHDLDVVMQISDWVVCMAEGRVVAEGPPEIVHANPVVIDAYLGRREGERRGADR